MTTLQKTIRFVSSILLLAALAISLYLNDSTSILLILLPLVLLNRAFIIPILFTIPTVEGIYATDTTASNTETIAIAMLMPILAYDLLKKNKVNIPTKILSLYLIFIFMTILGLIVYRQHREISDTIAHAAHVASIPVFGKVLAKILKIVFFITFLKLLINYGKEYMYKSLNLFRALSPYIILTIAGYTLAFGSVSQTFGGVLHFGSAHHGDFTATLDALAVFLYLALFERRKNYFEKVMALSAIVALLYLIMQMGSRNGLIMFGFVTVLSAILVLKNRSGSLQLIMMVLAIIAGTVGLYAFQDSPTIQRFIYEMTVDNGGERLDYWYAGYKAIGEEPVLGLGGDESASLYAVGKYSPGVEDHVMHNTFLEIAVEYGLMGLFFYLIFVGTVLRWCYMTFMYALRTNDLILGTPAVCYTVSIAAGMFISRVWETTLWYYLGIVFAIGIMWLYPQGSRRKRYIAPAIKQPRFTVVH